MILVLIFQGRVCVCECVYWLVQCFHCLLLLWCTFYLFCFLFSDFTFQHNITLWWMVKHFELLTHSVSVNIDGKYTHSHTIEVEVEVEKKRTLLFILCDWVVIQALKENRVILSTWQKTNFMERKKKTETLEYYALFTDIVTIIDTRSTWTRNWFRSMETNIYFKLFINDFRFGLVWLFWQLLLENLLSLSWEQKSTPQL